MFVIYELEYEITLSFVVMVGVIPSFLLLENDIVHRRQMAKGGYVNIGYLSGVGDGDFARASAYVEK